MFLLTAGPTNPSMYITLIRLSLYSAGLGPPGGVGGPPAWPESLPSLRYPVCESWVTLPPLLVFWKLDRAGRREWGGISAPGLSPALGTPLCYASNHTNGLCLPCLGDPESCWYPRRYPGPGLRENTGYRAQAWGHIDPDLHLALLFPFWSLALAASSPSFAKY